MTIILIPPSEGKNDGGTGRLGTLQPETYELLDAIFDYKGDLEKLYGVKAKRARAAHEMNQSLGPTMPAIKRYSGVVYKGIDYPSLNSAEKNRFIEHVRICSALFGLITPSHPIPNYKLSIDKLNAATIWKEKNSEMLKGHEVIDLLPQAHSKAISYTDGMIVEFIVTKNGRTMPAGHSAKLIKGKFIRWLIQHNFPESGEFKNFRVDGFNWNGSYFLKRQ
jgi:uncharacterized protein